MPPDCPNEANHTEMPEGYLTWHDAAERLGTAGFKQSKCHECGLYSIWHRPSGRKLRRYDDVSTKVRGID